MATSLPAAEPRRIIAGPLTIDVTGVHDECVVRLEGELDMFSSPRLRDELYELLASDRNVVLDLNELTFTDSSGIRCLMLVASRSRATGDRLRILPPGGGQVAQVLTLTNVDRYLPLAAA